MSRLQSLPFNFRSPSWPSVIVGCLGLICGVVGIASWTRSSGWLLEKASTQRLLTGGETVVPSTGQAVDTRQTVDVVRGEIRGGEASASTPTPPDYLWQESNESLIHDQPFVLISPRGLPDLAAVIPPSNPMTQGRVSLGGQFFYDPRISLDGTVSCASCHDPARGWTDHRVTSVGINNQLGARNSPTVLNTAFGRSYFVDGRSPSLEGQAQGPIQNKIEMGDQSYRQIIERLRAIPAYREQFRRVFGTDVTLDGLAKAIAAFERTALTGDSLYDRYEAGDPDDQAEGEPTERTFRLLTPAQKRGMILFGLASVLKPNDPDVSPADRERNARARCTNCHAGANFTDEMFHNLGVGYDPKVGKFSDLGRDAITPIGTKSEADRGAFKTPTLRDIDRTAPYMHDGSEATLEAVVEFYDRGGIRNPTLDRKLEPLNLSSAEKADLVAFLHALTGRTTPITPPILPPGPDGVAPDARGALNHPSSQSSAALPRMVPHGIASRR